ncbi:MAG: hypothetical protein ACR2PO_13385 [Methyloligellaceae bacterium]
MLGKSKAAIGGLLLASSALVMAPSVQAQDSGMMYAGRTVVSVGVGSAYLVLPDTKFGLVTNGVGNTIQKEENEFADYGWNVNGAIEIPTNFGNGRHGSFGVHGFYSRVEDDSNNRCATGTPAVQCGWMNIVDNPLIAQKNVFGALSTPVTLLNDHDREVDHWSVAAELKLGLGGHGGGMKDPQPVKRGYVAFGADFRGIDQELDIRGTATSPGITGTLSYSEDLDTNYYGAFVAYGRDYSLGGPNGLWARLGLQSSFRLQAGVYYADTDYDGLYATTASTGLIDNGALSLSEEDVAFIGSLTLETRKQINARTTISLQSEYTYYSWVPEMSYNDTDVALAGGSTGLNVGTSIDDDDAFSSRTSVRLTFKLGPDDIMQPEPLK